MKKQLEAIVKNLADDGHQVHVVTSPESIILSFRDVNSYSLKDRILEKAKGYLVASFGKGNVLEDFDKTTGDLDLYFRRN